MIDRHQSPQARRRPVRIGVAGLGRIGHMHAENVAGRTPALELVGVVDVDESLARETGDRLGAPQFASYDDLLREADLEAVVVATPTGAHAEMVEQAAAAGKHVFCEKPISLDLDSTLAAIEAARTNGVLLQVGFHRRFDPDWAAASARITSGELGDVYLFRSTLRDMSPPPLSYIRHSGGFFVDVAIHDLDAARWLVGEVDEVTAFGAAGSDPVSELGDVDNAVVVLGFAGGALGVLDESRVAGYGYECSTEVLGSKATVRIGNHRRVNNVWLTPGSAAVDWVRDFNELFAEAYLRELEDFAAAIRDGRAPSVTGEDGLAAFVLARACDRSRREGRTVRLRHEEGAGGVVYAMDVAA